MKVYTTVFVLLVLVGVILAGVLPVGQKEMTLLSDETVSLTPFVPTVENVPTEAPAEFAVLIAQNVSGTRSAPAVSPPPVVPKPAAPAQPDAAPVLASPMKTVAAAPVSFVYFFNGTRVMPNAPVKTVPIVYAPAPLTAPVVPVFVPQVVPSRVGMPKLVYPNGVVIKPKVYYPRQPVRNSFRAVTP